MKFQFPKDFTWGVATASYQIEGAYNQDGRGESIWDRFSKTPGNVLNGDTGDVACDHYNRYQDDVAMIKDLGVDSYRFSLAWPRIFPNGFGKPNSKGIDFYKRLVDELLAKDLIPFATLYHWDLPQVLQDNGGWTNRDTAKYFQDYAALVFEELGSVVQNWITLNEPWCSAQLGYGNGHHAPGIKDRKQAIQAAHYLLYAHGLAVQAFRATGLDGQIGITLNMSPKYPVTDSAEDIAAALRAFNVDSGWYLEPVLKGSYPQEIFDIYNKHNLAPEMEADDLKIINTQSDFLGINYYSRGIIGAGNPDSIFDYKQHPKVHKATRMGWEIYPEGIYDLLMLLHKNYGDIPMYITENGACFDDQLVNGKIHDNERTEYLQQHFAQCLRAIEAGVPLKGYYVWSLMDNFEWAFGYERRFGIVYVDYDTQTRYLKDSAKWYQQFLKGQK